MLFLYILLAIVGMIFFGFAGLWALVLGLFAFRLNRYRYRYMGLSDQRSWLPRWWRQWKFSLYQPVLCIVLALLTVCLLSFILKPLTVAGVIGGSEAEAAMQVGSLENRLYALTEWLKSQAVIYSFLAMALTLLVINLIWPAIKLFDEVPKMRVRIRSALIFLTTLSAFTFVSASNLNINRAMVTAKLKKEVRDVDDEIHRFNSESAAYRIVKDSIEELTQEEIRKLALVAKTVAAVENARLVSESLGREAGEKMEATLDPKKSGTPDRLDRAAVLDEVEDWPGLEERKARLTNEAKRAELLRKASRESMLVSLDKISVDLGDHLGGSMNRATKLVIGTFFSSLSQSVSDLCYRSGPRKSLASDTEIFEDFSKRYRSKGASQLSAGWMNDFPEVRDLEAISSTILAKSQEIDADLKLKSAAKAAKAAEDAADAAKAAKTAKSVLKFIF